MNKYVLLTLGFALAAFAQDPAQTTTSSQTTPQATTTQSTTKAKMRRSTTTSATSTTDTTTGMKSTMPAASTTPATSSTPGATGTQKIVERNSTMVPRNKGDQRSDVAYSTVDQKGKTVDGTTKVKSKKGEYKVTQTPPPRDKSTNP